MGESGVWAECRAGPTQKSRKKNSRVRCFRSTSGQLKDKDWSPRSALKRFTGLRSNQPNNKPGLPKDSNQCNKGLDHEERKSVNNVRWIEAFKAGEVIGKSSGDDGTE